MNWIEHLAGWNPDGGSGSFELALLLCLLMLLCAFSYAVWSAVHRWRYRRAPALGFSIGFRTDDATVRADGGLDIREATPTEISLIPKIRRP